MCSCVCASAWVFVSVCVCFRALQGQHKFIYGWHLMCGLAGFFRLYIWPSFCLFCQAQLTCAPHTLTHTHTLTHAYWHTPGQLHPEAWTFAWAFEKVVTAVGSIKRAAAFETRLRSMFVDTKRCLLKVDDKKKSERNWGKHLDSWDAEICTHRWSARQGGKFECLRG